MVREDFLQQNSFVDIDSYSECDRQSKMLAIIREYDKLCRDASERGAGLAALFDIPSREGIGRAKSVPAGEYAKTYAKLAEDMEREIAAVAEKGEDAL